MIDEDGISVAKKAFYSSLEIIFVLPTKNSIHSQAGLNWMFCVAFVSTCYMFGSICFL